ncbi:hypothetical protein GCM10008955_36520 [Deinococcus malanensis]|uniref:Uncharacterized protein n=1 Tax=Deinococcus malanensis TaxID=1706855 RepID=A0ABQ2F1S8_9DEIO|nr:hypothetical protein [Deinococcus malanensis]GGK39395.1 hypothetical protein GCM10008955_36520 [Deinococcus malanensis]
MLTPTAQQLAQALTTLPGHQIARAHSLGHSRLMINAVWHDQAISFVAHVTEVLDGELPEPPPVHPHPGEDRAAFLGGLRDALWLAGGALLLSAPAVWWAMGRPEVEGRPAGRTLTASVQDAASREG